MAVKRKFDASLDDSTPMSSKQLKLIPFPHYEPDLDVTMSDAEQSNAFLHHARIESNVSIASSESSSTSSASPTGSYPAFNIYPENNAQDMQVLTFDGSAPPPLKVGLLQPSAGFQHHGSNCSQVPKLRVACASGLNGSRTMWSFCEQCGAISMVDSD